MLAFCLQAFKFQTSSMDGLAHSNFSMGARAVRCWDERDNSACCACARACVFPHEHAPCPLFPTPLSFFSSLSVHVRSAMVVGTVELRWLRNLAAMLTQQSARSTYAFLRRTPHALRIRLCVPLCFHCVFLCVFKVVQQIKALGPVF